MKPFLKWPGNKFRVLDKILETLPKGKRLVEPFVGSGSIFINADYPSYVIAEKNTDLVAVYENLQKNGIEFIEYANSFFNSKNNTKLKYYKHRDTFNNTNDNMLKAALFIYLNRHGFNGLCRYNLKGGYNVPFGYYKKPYFPTTEMLYFYECIKKVKIRCWDYTKTLNHTKPGDVVYCDPPYVPLSKTSSFTQYGPFKFGEQEHIDLAKRAKILAKKGITVMISNHDTKFVNELYKDAKIKKINVQRSISCNANGRKKVKEVLAIFS